jgi:hypothetical protein
MSIYGEQWQCVCGWHNVFVRKRCRNCGREQPTATVIDFNAARAKREARQRAKAEAKQ